MQHVGLDKLIAAASDPSYKPPAKPLPKVKEVTPQFPWWVGCSLQRCLHIAPLSFQFIRFPVFTRWLAWNPTSHLCVMFWSVNSITVRYGMVPIFLVPTHRCCVLDASRAQVVWLWSGPQQAPAAPAPASTAPTGTQGRADHGPLHGKGSMDAHAAAPRRHALFAHLSTRAHAVHYYYARAIRARDGLKFKV